MKRKYNLSPDDLKSLYCKNVEITDANRQGLIDLWSDLFFVEGIQRFVKTQVEKSSTPTYLYVYSYDKDVTIREIAGIPENGKETNIFNKITL